MKGGIDVTVNPYENSFRPNFQQGDIGGDVVIMASFLSDGVTHHFSISLLLNNNTIELLV